MTNYPCVSLLGEQGYVYSTFLKQYNPLRDSQRAGQMAKEQQQQQPAAMVDEDFDDISLFVSGSGSSSLRSFNLNTTDSNSSLSGLQWELESNEELVDPVETEAQQVCVNHKCPCTHGHHFRGGLNTIVTLRCDINALLKVYTKSKVRKNNATNKTPLRQLR